MLKLVSIDKHDDLLPHTIVALLGLILANRGEVLGDGAACDGERLTLGFVDEPFDERRQPRLVVLVGARLAT